MQIKHFWITFKENIMDILIHLKNPSCVNYLNNIQTWTQVHACYMYMCMYRTNITASWSYLVEHHVPQNTVKWASQRHAISSISLAVSPSLSLTLPENPLYKHVYTVNVCTWIDERVVTGFETPAANFTNTMIRWVPDLHWTQSYQ